MSLSKKRHIECVFALIAAAAAIAIAIYAYRAVPERIEFLGFCAVWTSYNASRTIWPMRVRERFLEPKDLVRRAAHADAVAWFMFFVAGGLAIAVACVIGFFATRSVQRPWLPLAIGPAASFLVAFTMSLMWRAYARATRHAHAAADCAPTSPPPT